MTLLADSTLTQQSGLMLYLSWEELYDLLPQSFYAWNDVFILECDSAVDGLGHHPACA